MKFTSFLVKQKTGKARIADVLADFKLKLRELDLGIKETETLIEENNKALAAARIEFEKFAAKIEGENFDLANTIAEGRNMKLSLANLLNPQVSTGV